MLLPEDVRATLAKRYRSGRRNWLEGADRWPLNLRLGCPSEHEAEMQRDAVLSWVAAWKSWTGSGELVWIERRWRRLGSQLLPERILVPEPESVAAWVGDEKRWNRAHARYRHFVGRWPLLSSRLSRYFDQLADYEPEDIQRLEDLLGWLERNSESQLYPRQLPISGLDTKWLDGRMPIITDLFASIRGDVAADGDFFDRCGLKRPPHLVRVRILDDKARERVGGMEDVSARIDDLARLDLNISKVYIVENLQTGLAFSDEPESVVFMGLGYGVVLLAELPWVMQAKCIYWGDIDTHGFAILNNARAYLPNLESALMDEKTLLEHRSLWGYEKEQYSARELPMLSSAEQALYSALKHQRWGPNLRLEQERIAWEYVCARVGLLLTSPI